MDDRFLRRWPLPQPSLHGDKEERGSVLIIAGSREMPGAPILAANAALNAGAGKLAVATSASVARPCGRGYLHATPIGAAWRCELTRSPPAP
ncbi:MAG: NAD(P)H-hydrate dehydratase [Burkholderiaceae bacterium]